MVLTLRLCEKDGDEKKVEIKIPDKYIHPFARGTIWNYLKYILAVIQSCPLKDEVRDLDKAPALVIHATWQLILKNSSCIHVLYLLRNAILFV